MLFFCRGAFLIFFTLVLNSISLNLSAGEPSKGGQNFFEQCVRSISQLHSRGPRKVEALELYMRAFFENKGRHFEPKTYTQMIGIDYDRFLQEIGMEEQKNPRDFIMAFYSEYLGLRILDPRVPPFHFDSFLAAHGLDESAVLKPLLREDREEVLMQILLTHDLADLVSDRTDFSYSQWVRSYASSQREISELGLLYSELEALKSLLRRIEASHPDRIPTDQRQSLMTLVRYRMTLVETEIRVFAL